MADYLLQQVVLITIFTYNPSSDRFVTLFKVDLRLYSEHGFWSFGHVTQNGPKRNIVGDVLDGLRVWNAVIDRR